MINPAIHQHLETRLLLIRRVRAAAPAARARPGSARRVTSIFVNRLRLATSILILSPGWYAPAAPPIHPPSPAIVDGDDPVVHIQTRRRGPGVPRRTDVTINRPASLRVPPPMYGAAVLHVDRTEPEAVVIERLGVIEFVGRLRRLREPTLEMVPAASLITV